MQQIPTGKGMDVLVSSCETCSKDKRKWNAASQTLLFTSMF